MYELVGNTEEHVHEQVGPPRSLVVCSSTTLPFASLQGPFSQSQAGASCNVSLLHWRMQTCRGSLGTSMLRHCPCCMVF